MAMVMLVGTLNRVMIVELGVSAALVAILIALPVLAAPFRAFIGYRSDNHVSALGWRRVPYIWWGSLMMFGGFSIMPFSLLLLSGDGWGPSPLFFGHVGAVLAFILVGAGVHITQTAGLALATDLATPESRPRVVTLMYMMQLVGMVGTGLVFGWLLQDFSATRLVQVVQGAAVVSAVLHLIALWKQEARNPALTTGEGRKDSFSTMMRRFGATPGARRFLLGVGLGTFGFSMQDVILEPYGAEVLGMSVSQTTLLSALTALGGLVAFLIAARMMRSGFDCHRLSAIGLLAGRRGLRRGGDGGSHAVRRPLPGRRGAHRLRRRPLRGRHADGSHELRADRGRGPRARRLGRRAGDSGGPRHGGGRRDARRDRTTGGHGRPRQGAERADDGLHVRLPL